MKNVNTHKMYVHFYIIIFICVIFVVLALICDSPAKIISGYYKINISRSVLVSDYIVVGGIGATFINSAFSGFLFLFLLIRNKREPDGRIIASLWTTIGFSFFGKNFFNMLPILLGVLLYSKLNKVKFSELFVQAMLSATIAPLVSEIAFLNEDFSPIRIITKTSPKERSSKKPSPNRTKVGK